MVQSFGAKQQVFFSHKDGGGTTTTSITSRKSFPSMLTTGDIFMVNGRPHKVVGISGPDIAFKPPKNLSSEDKAKYKAALKILKDAAQQPGTVNHPSPGREGKLPGKGFGQLARCRDLAVEVE